MSNLSWFFYKGYYKGFTYWLSPKDRHQKETEEFFKAKNQLICNTTIAETGAWEMPGLMATELTTTYPGLLAGSGYTHETGKIGEVKLGFHFDFTTGMPVLPGSSVKGVIRAAFPQYETDTKKPWLRKKEKDTVIQKEKAKYIGNNLLGWQEEGEALYEKIHQLEQHIFEGLDTAQSEKNEKAVYYSLYRRDIFYDAFPVKGGANKNKMLGMDAITPHAHPLKNPIPLPFIKILPDVTLQFSFCNRAVDCFGLNAELRLKLYHTILNQLGAGAKTNVGYGQFKEKKFLTKMEEEIERIKKMAHTGVKLKLEDLPDKIKITKRPNQ